MRMVQYKLSNFIVLSGYSAAAYSLIGRILNAADL